MICPKCNTANASLANFCSQCGSKLENGSADPDKFPEQRQVTVVFCDLAGSTNLSEELNPEEFASYIAEYQSLCTNGIEKFKGYVHQYLGDGVVAFFGYPKASEGDATRAIRSGLHVIGRALQANDTNQQIPFKIRIGIHSGIVVSGELSGVNQVLGKTANIAARLQELAAINSIVVSSDTHHLTKRYFKFNNIGNSKIKGIRNPIEVFEVVNWKGLENRLDASDSKQLTPFVGRNHILDLMEEFWNEAKMKNGGGIMIIGDPGIGKSRLTNQFQDALKLTDDPRILNLRCSSLHQNSAYHPIIKWLKHDVLNLDENKNKKLDEFLEQNDLGEAVSKMVFSICLD